VFQHAALLPHLSVAGNLSYAVKRRHPGSQLSIGDVSKWLGIDAHLERRPDTLSGGERQRVAIARALLSNPLLMIMDEPLSSLDSEAKSSVLQYLQTLKDRIDVPTLYVTHSIDEVMRLADRVVWLDHGEVKGLGSVAEILSNLGLREFLGDDAGGVIEARVEGHDAGDHLTELSSPWGTLWVPALDNAAGTVLRLRVRAADVSLSLHREEASSILNVLPAVVDDVSDDSPGQALARLRCPADPSLALLARLTKRSVALLKLSEGSRVFARVKSVSVR
jgi:molybdate transport system ATP-binding protein